MSDDTFDGNRAIGLELYKSLRSEAASYVEKVPGLWLQKFSLVGAMIAFLLAKDQDLTERIPKGGILLVAAVMAIPLISVLIDAKILEYALHARTISRFLRRHTIPNSIEARWEVVLWGDEGDGGDRRDIQLASLRTVITVVVTAVPSALLIVLAAVLLGAVSDHFLPWVVAGGVVAAGYILATILFARWLWSSG